MNNLHTFFLLMIFSFFSMNCNKEIDIKTVKQEIIKTDMLFSDFSKKHGMKKAFLEYVAPSGVLLRNKSKPIEGKNAIVKIYEKFSDDSFILTWKPSFCDVSKSCDLGYTYGVYTMESLDSLNKPVVERGTYVSIWKKQENGKWKWVLDSGNEGLE